MTEKEIQTWFEEKVTSSTLINHITDISELNNIISVWQNREIEQPFSVDYLLRKSCISNAVEAINSLDDLVLISSDKSISQKKGEILRPDLLCFNWEQNTIILFELKENEQTARQAITELSAYEQELQNYLPYLSSCDIIHVIVSPEWSTLLDHSLASINLWSGMKALGLFLDTSGSDWKLKPRIPEAWTFIRANGLPPGALYTFNMVLYPVDGFENDDQEPYELNLARELISRNAEKLNVSGFSLIWENCNPSAQARWIITVGVIHPIGFFKHAEIHGDMNRKSELTRFLSDRLSDHEVNPPSSLFRITNQLRNLFENKFKIEIENLEPWESQRYNISNTGKPLIGDFFGGLFEFAYDRFISSRTFHDWNDPRFVIPLLDEISHFRCFDDGIIRLEDSFRIGELIGKLNFYQTYIDANAGYKGQSFLSAKFGWYKIELVDIIHRITDYFEDASTIQKWEAPSTNNFIDYINAFNLWFVSEVIGKFGNSIYSSCYELGLNCGGFFDDSISMSIDYNTLPAEFRDSGEIKKSINDLFDALIEYDVSHSPFETEIAIYQEKARNSILSNASWSFLIESVDSDDPFFSGNSSFANGINFNYHVFSLVKSIVIPGLNLTQEQLNIPLQKNKAQNVDLEYLKQGAKSLFNNGDKWVIVYYGNDSTIGILSSDSYPEVKLLEPINNIDDEVFFLNIHGGICFAQRLSWSTVNSELTNSAT